MSKRGLAWLGYIGKIKVESDSAQSGLEQSVINNTALVKVILLDLMV